MQEKREHTGDAVFDRFPLPGELLSFARDEVQEVNAHIHSPYSFSAFSSIQQAVSLAAREKIAVLGINDFTTTSGYPDFMHHTLTRHLFPLFNIEFITLLQEEQQAGVLVNDPGNPGRTYFCGKGLAYPFRPPAGYENFLEQLVEKGNQQVKEMTTLAVKHLQSVDPRLVLSWRWIQEKLAVHLVRERHLAKAIRMTVATHFSDPEEQRDIYRALFSGSVPNADVGEDAMLENEIRSRLLKAGGLAFVPEDPDTFPSLERVRGFILKAGGIPCYPMLLDNPEGGYTPFEEDPQKLATRLKGLGIYAVECIPPRNDAGLLTNYVRFLHREGFLVFMGTEHNTPEMISLKVSARNGMPLPEVLREISWESACVAAAHQYLVSRGMEGYCLPDGTCRTDQREEMARLGNGVIRYFNNIKS